MIKVKTEGYYVSEPFPWVDWHAGVKFQGNSFYVLKFEAEKCFIGNVNDIKEIDIENLVKTGNFGIFRQMENTIEIRYNPNTEFELKKFFTVVSPEVLIDENLKEYRYFIN